MPFVTLEQHEFAADHGLAAVPPIFYEVYDQRGVQPGPTVLLLHGAGGTYLSWPPRLRRLQHALVYAVDLPGHGQSESVTLAEGITLQIATYRAIVNALMAHWSLNNVVLVGHSMGGAIALDCALAATGKLPETLTGLVLVGTGATLPVNQRVFSGLEADFDAMTAKLVDWMYGPGLPDSQRERAIAELRKNPLPHLLADFHACNAFDVGSQLPRLRLPTLTICGALDKMTPIASSQQLATAIPACRLEIIPASGHMVMLEAPQIVTDLVQKFLNDTAISVADSTI